MELTDAGARRVADAESALGAVEDEVLSALSADERTTLYELLQRATVGHMADCSAAAAAPPPDC